MLNDDPLRQLARELRLGAGADLRAEAEAAELEAHLGRLRRRSLADVAREALHRGDGLTVVAHGRTIVGTPVFVGSDYLAIETPRLVADVRLERVILTVARRRTGGHRTRGGSTTFRARLCEYEQTGEPLTLVVSPAPHDLAGRIAVAARDHVVLEDPEREERVVPLEAISLVLRPRP